MNKSNRAAVERIVKQANHMLNGLRGQSYYRDNTDAREGILMMADGALTALRAMGRQRVGIATAAQETDRWVGFVLNDSGTYDLDSVPLSVDSAQQQPGESRSDWKTRTFGLHYGAGKEAQS